MTEYKIGDEFCSYGSEDLIYFSYVNNRYEILSDNEYINFIADAITHEIIHIVLYKEFNLTVSKLFDTIGYLFFNNYEYLDRIELTSPYHLTWKKTLEQYGFKYFCDCYNIDSTDVSIAARITTVRFLDKRHLDKM